MDSSMLHTIGTESLVLEEIVSVGLAQVTSVQIQAEKRRYAERDAIT